MTTNAAELASQLAKAAQQLITLKLAWGSSGNLSARLDEQTMLISGSGVGIDRLAPEDFVTCSIATGEPAAGSKRKPSKEVPMHSGIYRARPEARVVLHGSPLNTTLFACSGETPPSDIFIETMYYLERVGWVDYSPPGSGALGEQVHGAARNAEVIMLRNHGVILFDESFSEALMRFQTLELACEMVLKARAANLPLQRIPAASVREFLVSGRYKPRKPWHQP